MYIYIYIYIHTHNRVITKIDDAVLDNDQAAQIPGTTRNF